MNKLLLPLLCVCSIFTSESSFSLPINFGKNIGGLEYSELRSDDFAIYHEHRNREEAEFVLKSLAYAKPHLERWMDVKRNKTFPVILSSHSTNASFANFITDALEIQSGGFTSRDLSWHEYVHGSMYVHFKNILGPAGSAIHLVWLPSWFVEGLAEAISVSSSSSEQMAVERVYALSGHWPEFNKIHSLYNKHDFAALGYALSGSFVKYLFSHYSDVSLPELLRDFYQTSMPWHWPYALTPFFDSLPFDRVCRKHFGKNTEELYEEFKKNRSEYWLSLSQKNDVERAFFLESLKNVQDRSQLYDFSDTGSPWFEGGSLHAYEWRNGYKYKISFKVAEKLELATAPFEEELVAKSGQASEEEHFARDDGDTSGKRYRVFRRNTIDSRKISYIAREGLPLIDRGEAQILTIYNLKNHLLWEEHSGDESRICQNDWKAETTVLCFEKTRGPLSSSLMTIIGGKAVVKKTEQTLAGNFFSYHYWDPESFKFTEQSEKTRLEIISLHTSRNRMFRRVRGLSHDYLEETSDTPWSTCKRQLKLVDSVLSVDFDHKSDLSFFKFFDGEFERGVLAPTDSLPWKNTCAITSHHVSPLILTALSQRDLTLNESLLAMNSLESFETFKAPTANAPVATQTHPPIASEAIYYEKARSHFRHVVTVPWLGQDSDGMQVALMSVPLMDEMQNQEFRAYLGYGLAGGYPHTQLSYSNNSSVIGWDVSVYKYQLWDGRYNVNAGKTYEDGTKLPIVAKEAYLTEQGVDVGISTYSTKLRVLANLGIKYSDLSNYKAGPANRIGKLIETQSSLSYSDYLGSWFWSASLVAENAPKIPESDFQYDKTSLFLSGGKSFDWRSLTIRTSLSGSQTRGPKRRTLEEVYRPVRVFVPGAGGGGYNNFSTPLTGQGSLFTAIFGDTRLESETNLSVLLFEDIAWVYKIFYLDSIIATAFFKEGMIGRGNFDASKFTKVTSHGYQADSTIDIKGVNLNIGLGVGQVIKEDWQSYLSFGFSALF